MEASKSFKLMLEQIRSCMIYYFLSNPINKKKNYVKTYTKRKTKSNQNSGFELDYNEKWKKILRNRRRRGR
jgi:hypothetical protein